MPLAVCAIADRPPGAGSALRRLQFREDLPRPQRCISGAVSTVMGQNDPLSMENDLRIATRLDRPGRGGRSIELGEWKLSAATRSVIHSPHTLPLRPPYPLSIRRSSRNRSIGQSVRAGRTFYVVSLSHGQMRVCPDGGYSQWLCERVRELIHRGSVIRWVFTLTRSHARGDRWPGQVNAPRTWSSTIKLLGYNRWIDGPQWDLGGFAFWRIHRECAIYWA